MITLSKRVSGLSGEEWPRPPPPPLHCSFERTRSDPLRLLTSLKLLPRTKQRDFLAAAAMRSLAIFSELSSRFASPEDGRMEARSRFGRHVRARLGNLASRLPVGLISAAARRKGGLGWYLARLQLGLPKGFGILKSLVNFTKTL